MGTIRKGILGGFSGKVGPVIGSSWRGKDVMRSLPKKSSREASEKQLAQRAKFSLAARFLRPLQPKLSKYFGRADGENPRYSEAISYHMREAIAGTYPNFTLDFPRVVLTKGELPGFKNAALIPEAKTVVTLSWDDNSGKGQAEANDVLLCVFYNADKQMSEVEHSVTRGFASALVNLPASWSGDTVYCWISFTGIDDKLASNSEFMGSFVVL